MSDLWMLREGMTLRPFGSESAEVFSKIPFGKMVYVEVKQPRNSKFSRLFWTMCQRIGDAVGLHRHEITDILCIRTGHCTVVNTKRETFKLPKSLSFAKMDETEFREFFDKCVTIIETEWGIARPDILECVKDLLERDAA